MSRCFPFPPPGYEKKPRSEEALLEEEKRKDKKHKKDKKDKEKREGKDKKEKEKSDGKHKEKKDKKEKHRDKKEKHRDKKKEKGKDKEKSSISEDGTVTRLPETRSEEKLHTREEHFKDKNRGSEEKRIASQFQGQNGQEYIGNGILARETDESKFVQELGRRIRDAGTVTSKPVERSSGADYRENEESHRLSVGDPQDLAEHKERNGERRADDRKGESRGLGDEARFSRNTMVQTVAGLTKHKVEDMSVPAQGITEKRMEGKSKEKSDDKRGEKRKDKKDKKSHGKDKGREKDKKEKEERTDITKIDQDGSKWLLRNEFTGSKSNHTSQLPADDNKQLSTSDNLKKRKDVGTNGFLHENELRPYRLPRLTSHQLPENGRILEPSQAPRALSSDKQGFAFQDRTNGKEHRVNGIIEAPSSYISSQKPPLAAARSVKDMEVLNKPLPTDQVVEAPKKPSQAHQVTDASKKRRQADQMAEPSKRPPHPDLKYLSQVLSVPTMDEWSEVDDQDWLFSSKVSPSLKPVVASTGDNTEQRVWSEALHIESADIYALPYVIPY